MGLVSPPYWPSTERFKVQPPDYGPRAEFGYALALTGTSMIVGAPSDDGLSENAGAVYAYDIKVQRVSFTLAQYVALEGSDNFVTINLVRDSAFAHEALTVEYATSDLTAKGVDRARYDECVELPNALRIGCGDYLQTTGEVTFAAGTSTALFQVYIVNDLCYEHNMEYVQLTLSIPGSAALQGENYFAKLRIDDDDFDDTTCAQFL